MIKLKLFQSEWEGLYNNPIQYFNLLKKQNEVPISDFILQRRLRKAFLMQLPGLEKKCLTAKNKDGAKMVTLEYFEALAFLELLKVYPIKQTDEWLYNLINMTINFLDNQL